jgi:hypothetical protein
MPEGNASSCTSDAQTVHPSAGFSQSHTLNPHSFEAPFNLALLCHKLGDSQESFDLVNKSLACFPGHPESSELLKLLHERFG